MTIEVKARQIVERFSQFSNWEDSYREVIKMGKEVPSLPEEEQLDKFLVKGCQSKVWLIPEYTDGIFSFKTDSDAFIVKGIAELLRHVYSGHRPSEILNFKQDFLKEIGITDHLSLNRTNGLAQMLKQIQMYAIAYEGLHQKGIMSL